MGYSDAVEKLRLRIGLERVIDGGDMRPVSDAKVQARGEREFAAAVVAAYAGKSVEEVMADVERA